MGMGVISLPFLFWLLWKNAIQLVITITPNLKYEKLVIVKGLVMNQLYGMYALLCSFEVLRWNGLCNSRSFTSKKWVMFVQKLPMPSSVPLLCVNLTELSQARSNDGQLRWPCGFHICYIDNHYIIPNSWVIMPLNGWWYIILAHPSSFVISKA